MYRVLHKVQSATLSAKQMYEVDPWHNKVSHYFSNILTARTQKKAPLPPSNFRMRKFGAMEIINKDSYM